VYFALHDSKTPMKIGIMAVAMNILLNLILVGPMKHNGLALATSVAGTFAALVKFLLLKKKKISVEYRKMLNTFIKAAVSAVTMGVFVYAMAKHVVYIPGGEASWQFVKLVAVCAFGAMVYAVMLYVFKVEEFIEILWHFKEKLKGNSWLEK